MEVLQVRLRLAGRNTYEPPVTFSFRGAGRSVSGSSRAEALLPEAHERVLPRIRSCPVPPVIPHRCDKPPRDSCQPSAI